MKNKTTYSFNKAISILSVIMLSIFTAMGVKAQNLNALFYGTPAGSGGGGIYLDVSVLDGVFGTVTVNGTTRTTDFLSGMTFTSLPTTLSAFSGIQLVVVNGYDGPITLAQADNLIAYVKQGGILVGSMEAIYVTTINKDINVYMAENLLTQSPLPAITANPFGSETENPNSAYHNEGGPLSLNSQATSVPTTGTASTFTGIPSESVIYVAKKPTNAATCGDNILDFIAPSYPGGITALDKGIKGFAYLSGEAEGPLTANFYTRNNTQANINLAQLIYDFLYSPNAMAARRSWSKTTSNVNTFCPVSSTSTECAAGYTAPPLTATTLANACPSYTVNLNSLHTATVPIGSSLVWYDNAAHFGLAISNPAAVAANATYYAFYYDPSINCYSPASTGVVVTITNCCAINGSNFISVNSPTSVNGVTVSRSITGNAVSEISGGGGNNTCGVNRTGTSYAAYLVTQQGGPSTTGSVTFTFDKPVNNVVVRSLAMHAGNSPAESMTITTNNGTVTTSSIYECSVTKSGNTYTSTYPSSSSPGGDVVTTVTSTLPYTTLTVTGVSNLSNGGFYIDICGSSIQAATATPSCAAGTAAPVINSN